VQKFFIPAKNPEDWKTLLAEPEKHWKTGYSAKATAYCWSEAAGFPESVRNAFARSGISVFQNIELLFAFPEYQVELPPYGTHPSQNDIFVLGRAEGRLISITVEGKVSEPFGPTVVEWLADGSEGKKIRLAHLREVVGLRGVKLDGIRYQLLHRTASALIMARIFNAQSALMLVHSFSPEYASFEDYRNFAKVFNLDAEKDVLVGAADVDGKKLYLGWVRGKEEYLQR
jgi:hypothetical protein